MAALQVVTSVDSGYATLLAQGNLQAHELTVDGEIYFYQRVDNGDVITFHLIPSTGELSSLRTLLQHNNITCRGWYPPEGVRDEA